LKGTLKIAIPMAGLGSRLRPHTWSKPKALMQVAGKTILAHLLDGFQQLPDPGNVELIFIIGYLGDQIRKYMQENFPGVKAHFVVQDEMKGQSVALSLAREYLQGPLIILLGDTLAEADFTVIEKTDLDGIAWVKPVPDPRRFGVAEIDPQGLVTRLIEKPELMENNRVVIGLYYFQQAETILQAIDQQIASGRTLRNEFFLTDAINVWLTGGKRMRTMEVGNWLDAGTPEVMLETNRFLLDRAGGTLPHLPGVKILAPVAIHPDVIIENSTIGPYVSLASGCRIKDSVIRDSIIEVNTRIDASELTRSLIGSDVSIDGIKGELDVGDNCRLSGI
jgi:glucose-1-phosphate thymidylyltransferase